ncbi:MAG: VOC family protein [Myxococcota bacterium]
MQDRWEEDTSPPGLVLPRRQGGSLDHIALGVPDMPRALEEIAERTGATPFSNEPEPGQWYWSGALALGDDAFLEILGPNPAHQGFQPLKQLVSGYDAPRLLFWYVATADFAAFRERAQTLGAPLERVERVDFIRNSVAIDYERGILGPGFVSQRPCIIEWRKRDLHPDADRRCNLQSLQLRHPEAAKMNTLFGSLGIEQVVEEGPSWIALTLDTPKGPVVFENPGESLVGLSSVLRMARLFLRYLRA